MERHVCFVFYVVVFLSRGELRAERIEMKFSLKIGLSTGILGISCTARFVKALQCSTPKLIPDSTIFIIIIALLLFFKPQNW